MNNYKIMENTVAKFGPNKKMGLFKNIIKKIFIYKTSYKEIAIFCKQMSLLLSAGITVSDSLATIAEESKNKLLKENLNNIALNIEQGVSASEGMGNSRNLFPKFMINMISIGEENGGLNNIFANLCEYYIKQNRILKKVRSAMAYPSIVFILTICVMSFLLIKIIPTFSQTLTSLGGELPVITRIIIELSHFLVVNALEIAITILLMSFLFALIIKKQKIRDLLDSFIIKVPYIGKLFLQTYELKFLRSISILLSGGSSLINSIEKLIDMTRNKEINRRLIICLNEIKEGNSFLKSIKNTKIFDTTVISLLKVGEETGSISQMFIKSADIVDEEIYGEIEKMTTLIEPIMIIVLAAMVGIVILSVILPMMKINDCIGA